MPLTITKTKLQGLVIIIPHQFHDERGGLNKYFDKDIYSKHGLNLQFTEMSTIVSNKGTLRGLHYQKSPSQGKFIYAITGTIFFVVMDLRENSHTFGEYECFILSANLGNSIYIPEDFATGSLSLEENTVISYLCTDQYIPENCSGIIWNDRELNIPWPLKNLDVPLIISEKDKKLQTFRQYTDTLNEAY